MKTQKLRDLQLDQQQEQQRLQSIYTAQKQLYQQQLEGEADAAVPPLEATDAPPSNDELAQLKKMLEGKEDALQKAREFERRYKRLEAILGDTDPVKLQELREADNRLKREQEEREKLLIDAKNSVAAEYKSQIQELNSTVQKLTLEKQRNALTFDLFREYNEAGGDGTKFQGFVRLAEAGGIFHRTESGEIQVKDSAGRLVVTKAEDGTLRPATPKEFMKLLIQGKLDDEFSIPDADYLKTAFSAYNKAQGANLPTRNGVPGNKSFADMTQAELQKYAFQE